VRVLRQIRRSFDQLIGWPYGSGPRDHSKLWFRDRKDRRANALKVRGDGEGKLETAKLPDGVGTHRDNVWLALGSLAFVAGSGLVTAAWLGFIAIAVTPSTTHMPLSFEIVGWIIVAAGVYALYWGTRIFRFFFYGRPRLPQTLKEKEVTGGPEGTTSVRPKGEEAATPKVAA
jgi:hypothetical protein